MDCGLPGYMKLHVAVIKPYFSLSQVAKVEVKEDQKHAEEQDGKYIKRNVRRRVGDAEEEEGDGCELSLSLSLQYHPSSQRSNTSSTSEISSSEAFSSYSRSNYKDCWGSSSSTKPSIYLDLSIALCGN